MSAVRVGALGGTFDPPHYGHLVGAQEARALLDLQTVLFVPTGIPPHKLAEPVTQPHHRVRMTELAIAENQSFRLSRADVDRKGRSYTVDLIPHLKEEMGRDCELYFLIGMDSLRELAAWKDPSSIIAQCHLVAFSRPNYPPVDLDELEKSVPGARERITILRTPGVDISATELRMRIARHEPVRYLLPPAVEEYIRAEELYISATVPQAARQAQKRTYHLKPDAF